MLPVRYTHKENRYIIDEGCGRLAAAAASGSATVQVTTASTNARRRTAARASIRAANGTLPADVFTADIETPRGRRACVVRAADDRTGAHAHLFGRHVLPFRIPRHFDCALRCQRERRRGLCPAAAVRSLV